MSAHTPRLSAAAWAALAAMQQGREFRSGPHLAVLAEHGFIERTGPSGRYEPTQLGIRELGFEEANARLIAAAPDLLAALRQLDNGSKYSAEVCNIARAAIAKAQGRS